MVSTPHSTCPVRCLRRTRLGLASPFSKPCKRVKPNSDTVVEPLTGASWIVEFSHLDSCCFERSVHSFAAQFPDDLQLISIL